MEWLDYEDSYEAKGEQPRDTKIDEAKEVILGMFEENRKAVYYLKQLQVLLERQFFHWITGFALAELVTEGKVGAEDVSVGTQKVRFVFHRSHRRRKLQIRRAMKVIERYSQPEIARGCGYQAENLWLVALAEYKFEVIGRDTREYEGRVWKTTGHNLDFIVRRDGVGYGAEVKNTWDYIPPQEFRTKMRMCRFLGIRPLFIWRYAPKNYMYEVYEQGGYGLVFVAHIYPLGQEGLVEEIRGVLGLECDAPRRIPDGLLERFVRWHEGSLR